MDKHLGVEWMKDKGHSKKDVADFKKWRSEKRKKDMAKKRAYKEWLKKAEKYPEPFDWSKHQDKRISGG